jgi:hypothetical protein
MVFFFINKFLYICFFLSLLIQDHKFKIPRICLLQAMLETLDP